MIIREYLVPILSGIFPWSCISQASNPHVSEEEYPRISKNYEVSGNQIIRRGQRMDILNVRNDVKRAKVQRLIINNQTSLDRHGYITLQSDPRFDNEQTVPFPTSASSRPIITDDISYRTTFLS